MAAGLDGRGRGVGDQDADDLTSPPGRPSDGASGIWTRPWPEGRSNPRFAVCVQNDGYEASLERNKLYVVLPDPDAEREGDVRVVRRESMPSS